jgi:hypothetical protein
MSPAPVREPGQCLEKQSLIDQIDKAIALTITIYREAVESVLSGDNPTDRSIQHRLLDAREMKALLIRQLRDHETEHGC